MYVHVHVHVCFHQLFLSVDFDLSPPGRDAANIEMTYTQGRQAGVVPTINVSFDNPLGLSAGNGKTGIFTFIDGKWTLTSS